MVYKKNNTIQYTPVKYRLTNVSKKSTIVSCRLTKVRASPEYSKRIQHTSIVHYALYTVCCKLYSVHCTIYSIM